MVNHKLQERIDVHCHALPARYRQHLLDNGHQHVDGMPAIPIWDPKDHIRIMKERNITKTILSISSPGTNLTPKSSLEAAATTRQANEDIAAVCAEYPEQFFFFASLPLPLVSESLLEIDHALDTLGAVGFCLVSNAHGLYLGDPSFTPILQKLNDRKAIIFIHPTTCNLLLPSPSAQSQAPSAQPATDVLPVTVLPYPRPMMEFMFDETRVVANILLSGLLDMYPDITFIMSHCGCALPPIIDRIGAFDSILYSRPDSSQRFKDLLRTRFYFDLAGKPFPDQIWGLVRMLGGGGEGMGIGEAELEEVSKRLVYGSDFPFTPEPAVVKLQGLMDEGLGKIFGEERKKEIYVGNAKRLFGL
ncbi:amidohydrolase [Mollisia scopiformis]|uniref:6-methylsalicylate decarboxylase n=1 Tax=Mollisia scopiformis TaxID=149040 RepID=A0A194XPP0_MOLSC|nr:amidohydrolase [Mollisia scopiformis]KUJ21707.1 amidohydrolase [Mollisia scopiformis]